MVYLSFISLGLPDSLLGAAWPISHQFFNVSLSSAAIVSLIASIGTISSALFSTYFIQKYGTFKIVVVSIGLTAIALLGIALSPSFIWLCIFAIPLGLGGGNVDAALNHFVAVHFEAKHMSWLHSFWGIGASTGPLMMAFFLARGTFWQGPYYLISLIQFSLILSLVLQRKVWRPYDVENLVSEEHAPVSIQQAIVSPKVIYAMASFLVYVAMEGAVGLWGASFLVSVRNFSVDQAALVGSFFYGSLTIGRLLDGFLSLKFKNEHRLLTGLTLGFLGILLLLISSDGRLSLMSFMLMGLGFAPTYPVMIHETPKRFGKALSQAVIGLQMASSYIGFALMPIVIGLVSNRFGLAFLPYFLGILMGILMMLTLSLQHFVKQRSLVK